MMILPGFPTMLHEAPSAGGLSVTFGDLEDGQPLYVSATAASAFGVPQTGSLTGDPTMHGGTLDVLYVNKDIDWAEIELYIYGGSFSDFGLVIGGHGFLMEYDDSAMGYTFYQSDDFPLIDSNFVTGVPYTLEYVAL